ncbi:MAG: hypothetical protein QOI80_2970, partial [Solirubrobacteraceae bacterium]|nr:hypothetical protein [Solirubrobacteraceae bacterium]
ASQYHPEFKSRPQRPAPLFREFVKAALAYRDAREGEPAEAEPEITAEALDPAGRFNRE